MKQENEFDNNYTIVSITSSIIFSVYFIIGIFFLNLTYVPQVINAHSFLGIFILLAYYILTSIVLIPVLILINSIVCLLIKKMSKYIYEKNIILGFIIFPAFITIIPYIMTYSVSSYIGKISSFDYYYLYFNTWVCSLLQYNWIIRNMTEKTKKINQKQSEFIKSLDRIDYF